MKEVLYYVDFKKALLGKSIHCQICKAVIFPLSLGKCKCTKEKLKVRKVYK